MRNEGKFFAMAGVAMILLLSGAGIASAGCGVSATSAATSWPRIRARAGARRDSVFGFRSGAGRQDGDGRAVQREFFDGDPRRRWPMETRSSTLRLERSRAIARDARGAT